MPGGGPGGGPDAPASEVCDTLEDEDVETPDDAEARSLRKVERSFVSCESSELALLDDVEDEALSVCRSELSWLRSFCSVDRRLELLDDDALLLSETPGGGPGGGPCGPPNEILDALDVDDAEARSLRKVERSVVSCESSLLALVDDDEEALSVCKSELSWLRSFCSVDKMLELLDDDALLAVGTPGGGPKSFSPLISPPPAALVFICASIASSVDESVTPLEASVADVAVADDALDALLKPVLDAFAPPLALARLARSSCQSAYCWLSPDTERLMEKSLRRMKDFVSPIA